MHTNVCLEKPGWILSIRKLTKSLPFLDMVVAIQNLRQPTSLRQLQKIIGIINY